jgi:hypothetical protein
MYAKIFEPLYNDAVLFKFQCTQKEHRNLAKMQILMKQIQRWSPRVCIPDKLQCGTQKGPLTNEAVV